MTIGEKLEATKGRPSGFDYMRLVLALGVVCWHTIVLTYGFDFQRQLWVTPWYRMMPLGLLPAFFSLSGFLVAGSLERCKTLAGFLYLRAIRIFPALAVEVVVSAILIGPAMTRLSLQDYFLDPKLYSYLRNIVGDIHYELPGVFLQNPFPSIVNGQLWTVPFELECYIVLTVFALIGIIARPQLFLLIVAGLIAFEVFGYARDHHRYAMNFRGNELVVCFLIGVLLYKLRAIISYDRRLGVAAVGLSLLCFWIPGGDRLAALPVTYATVFLGLTDPRRMALLEPGDYSYGIFLYGYPIQQAVVATGLVPLNGLITLAAALPIVILVAACSWHFWEKRMLGLRRFLPAVDRAFWFTQPNLLLPRIAALPTPVEAD